MLIKIFQRMKGPKVKRIIVFMYAVLSETEIFYCIICFVGQNNIQNRFCKTVVIVEKKITKKNDICTISFHENATAGYFLANT